MTKINSHITLLTALFLLASCGDIKTVIQSPKVALKPTYKPVAAKPGNDPLAGQQWNLQKINVGKAWELLPGGGTHRLRIAILSSGVDYNHEDLSGNLYVNQRENTGPTSLSPNPIDGKDSDGNGYVDDLLGWDVVDGDGFPYDNLGDGTVAAGIIGAVHNNSVGLLGIMKEVTIIPVRYIDASGTASVERLIEAFRYLDKVNPKPDVILIQAANVDFTFSEGIDMDGFVDDGFGGFTEKDALDVELKKWAAADVPLIVSAGNRNSDVATVKGVITAFAEQSNSILVTSSDKSDAKPAIANFSPRLVHTAAPGVDVLAALPGNTYGARKGTFIAAAHVAGTLGLALTKYYGQKTTKDFKTALLNPAGSDLLSNFESYNMGSNRLNAGKFMEVLGTK